MIVESIVFYDDETGKYYTTNEYFDHSVIADSVDIKEDLIPLENYESENQ
jgi:hypothetical protein